MRLLGQLVAVEVVSAGSFVVATVGATLYIDDMADFPEGGGQLTVGGVTVAYTSAVDGQGAGDYLTLTAPLVPPPASRALVYLAPPVLTKRALVALPIGEPGEAVTAIVPSGHL